MRSRQARCKDEKCDRRAHENMSVFQNLSENETYRNYTIGKCDDEGQLYSNVSHLHEKEMNRIDYGFSSSPNKDYKCNEGYKIHKNSLSYNRGVRRPISSTLQLLSNQYISKIPLYTRSHKHARWTNFQRISQSYYI